VLVLAKGSAVTWYTGEMGLFGPVFGSEGLVSPLTRRRRDLRTQTTKSMRQKTSTAPPPTAMPTIIFKSRTRPEAIEPTEFDAETVMSGAPEEVVLLELVDSKVEDLLSLEYLGLFADLARMDSRRTLGMA
jgi:hypothetical protein